MGSGVTEQDLASPAAGAGINLNMDNIATKPQGGLFNANKT